MGRAPRGPLLTPGAAWWWLGGQGSPFPGLVLAEKMHSKERNKLQDCLACKIGEEGGKTQEVSIPQAGRGAGCWRRGCWKDTGMLVPAGAAWGEWLGLGNTPAVEQRPWL